MTLNELVAKYVQLRDKKDALRAKYRAKEKKINEALILLEAALIKSLDSLGIESARSEGGTCYLSHRTSATVADRDAFFEFVESHGAWDMLESRCSKTAVEQYLEAEGQLPPGVNRRVERTLGVNRPKTR